MFILILLLTILVMVFGETEDGSIDLSHFGTDIYGKPIAQNSRSFASQHGNPEERGPYLEGDLLIPVSSKNGIKSTASRWVNGEVPFEILGSFSQSDFLQIDRAIKEYHKYTCIKFVPKRQFDNDYISITSGSTGCWSSVGRIGGKQMVNLQTPDCTYFIGTVIHELLHALGFIHEQNREERDGFVFVRFNNIEADKRSNFEKLKAGEASGFGVAYDYGSVMHYSSSAFSKNGQRTIEPKMKTTETLGQRNGFSRKDVEKINKMYKC